MLRVWRPRGRRYTVYFQLYSTPTGVFNNIWVLMINIVSITKDNLVAAVQTYLAREMPKGCRCTI